VTTAEPLGAKYVLEGSLNEFVLTMKLKLQKSGEYIFGMSFNFKSAMFQDSKYSFCDPFWVSAGCFMSQLSEEQKNLTQ
jgi:hypothetical protein